MSLRVRTARISFRGPDRLDITRKSAEPWARAAFAPSWAILSVVLEARRQGLPDEPLWNEYVEAYLGEMRASYRRDPAPWQRLLASPSVVLVCYCAEPERCHRTLLGRTILPKLGAVFEGEVSNGC